MIKSETFKLYVPIIETYVNHPGIPLQDIADYFNVNHQTVSRAITMYYKRPEFTVIINSGIDSERAIYQESVLSLVQKVKL